MLNIPVLSVIIPIYNSESYLEECLNSLVNQKLQNIEIILVNDGSHDGSSEIIRKYSNTHNNIIVLNQKNLGVVRARLSGLKIARGEYIAWVDNDDFVDLTMYEKMYNQAKKSDLDVVICNYNLYPKSISSKSIWYNEFRGEIDIEFVHRNTVLWNKIYKKQYLVEINYLSLLKELGESSFMLLLIYAKKVGTINEKLYFYRVGHGSLSNFSNISWYKDGVKTAQSRSAKLLNSEIKNQWYLYSEHLAYMSIISYLIVCARQGEKKEYKKYREIIQKNNYLNNKLNGPILLKDYGYIKYIALKYIIQKSYTLSKLITRITI